MARSRLDRILLLLVFAATVAGVTGCATDPRYQQGLEWVLWMEAEKKRLNDAGFPQYSFASS